MTSSTPLSRSLAAIGQSPVRLEDDRLLRGLGRFVGALQLTGVAHASVVRSPYARARLGKVDVSGALAMPGVVAVFTHDDLIAAGIGPLGFHAAVGGEDGGEMSAPPRHALAREELRYVGEPVALVVAASRNAAVDAGEAVSFEAEPLAAVTGVERAVAPDAPALWPGAPSNIVGRYEYGDRAQVDAAMARAARVVSLRVANNRVAPSAMEPRAAIGEWDAATGRATLQSASQTPHLTRRVIAAAMGMPEEAVRIVVRDIGGGFGSKLAVYPEDVLVLFAARALGRPVRWVADRSEAFLSDTHGRDHVSQCELALDADGRFLAMRVRDLADMGAYVS